MPAATGLKPTGEVPLLIELQLPTASGSTPHPLSYHLLQRLSHLISSQACLGTHTLPAVSQCLLLGICVLPHPFDWQVAPTLDIIEAMAATRSVGVREAARAPAFRMFGGDGLDDRGPGPNAAGQRRRVTADTHKREGPAHAR